MNPEGTSLIENIAERLGTNRLILPSMRISDIIDILLVAFIIYNIVKWIRQTRAYSLFRGIMIIAAISLISYRFHFYTLTWIIEKTFSVGIIAIIIIFQPELRRALEQIGTRSQTALSAVFSASKGDDITMQSIDHIIAACMRMSEDKTGALIVIERNVAIGDIVNSSGVSLNADISSQLLVNIFVDKTPLHDGAVIIRGNRIVSASCILPVTNAEIGQEFGTRHRAAVGMSEISDAFIIVVSEETGKISLADNGKLRRNVGESQLRKAMKELVAKKEVKSFGKLWKELKR